MVVALPNPGFQLKNSPVAPRGGGAKSGGALPKLRILCPKTTFFGPKWHRNLVKTAKRRETIATLHMRPDCPVTKRPLLPSSSTICPRNGPKMANNGLNVRHLCQTGPKPRTDRILGYVAQNRIPRAPSPPATPHFLWFPRYVCVCVCVYVCMYVYPLIYTPLPNSRWLHHTLYGTCEGYNLVHTRGGRG